MMIYLLLVKWQLTLILLMEFEPSFQSIAGVTYRDDFDFEERYANVNECDPFYWHPLHLPEYCADKFEKIIRSKMGQHAPVKKNKTRDKKKKKENDIYTLHVPDIQVGYIPAISEEAKHEFETSSSEFEIEYSPQWNPEFDWNVSEDVEIESLSPYEKMINQLRRDLTSHPSAPTVGYVPNIGQVAVYRQPISKSSRKIIKELTKAYQKSGSHKSRKSGSSRIVIDPTTLKIKKKNKHGHHRTKKTKT